MIQTNSQPLQDILLAFLRQEGLVMGEMVNRYTKQVFVRDSKLHVQLTSAPLRQNLMMEHKRIAQKLNDHVGSYVISDVSFF